MCAISPNFAGRGLQNSSDIGGTDLPETRCLHIDVERLRRDGIFRCSCHNAQSKQQQPAEDYPCQRSGFHVTSADERAGA